MKFTKDLVYKTIYISLILQVLTTAVSLDGFNYKLNPIDDSLKDVLKIETVVQFIEGFVYLWISFAITNLDTMVDRRYLDWAITTPLMLISTIIFMEYNLIKEKYKKGIKTEEFLQENIPEIIQIVIFNGLMLLFGYLGEKNIMNKDLSIIIGFIFFFLTFRLIYSRYVNNNDTNLKLFIFIFVIWSLYGVSAKFGPVPKNVSYNFLDIIAKNFYGLFIYYKILQIKQV
tara:strand:- start:3293 stop:3979 length:687 start_codon:yes stop_codon:yes gene_type:complete